MENFTVNLCRSSHRSGLSPSPLPYYEPLPPGPGFRQSLILLNFSSAPLNDFQPITGNLRYMMGFVISLFIAALILSRLWL